MTKLLEKSEIARAKANEQRLEIERGLKVAKRVDEIRETRVREEAELEEWRRTATDSVKAEIATLISKRENLSTDVETLERRREAALIPLDQERKEIKEARQALKKDQIEIATERTSLSSMAKRLQKREENLEIAFRGLENDKSETKKLLKEAKDDRKEAKSLLESAERREKEVNLYVEDQNIELLRREETVAARERDIQLSLDFIVLKTNEQANKDREIQDRYQELERTFTRLKKK